MPLRYIGGGEVELHSFITSVLFEDEWSSLQTYRFTPGNKLQCQFNWRIGAPHTPIRIFWRRETPLAFLGIRTPDRPVLSPVGKPHTDNFPTF